jgi:hypothetical protein
MSLRPALKLGDTHEQAATDTDDAEVGHDVAFEVVAAHPERDGCFVDRERDARHAARFQQRVHRILADG